jgi:Ca2+/H+ antiporter, TMEM165/GDT1 family
MVVFIIQHKQIKRKMKNFWIAKIVKILILVACFILLMGTAVMLLWNWLMPALFNLPIIDFGQALGLTVLSRILTGGFRMGVGTASKEQWEQKRQMWEKFSAMTPEERDKWKTEWRDRCRNRPRMGFKHYDEKEGADQI